MVVVFGLGVVGKDAGDDVGGCRSAGELGVVARRHGRRCGAVLRAPGDTASAVKRSVASLRGCGHGYAMARGEKLSATMGNGARGREWRGRAQEKQQGLTVDPSEAETRPGKRRRQRRVVGDLGGRR